MCGIIAAAGSPDVLTHLSDLECHNLIGHRGIRGRRMVDKGGTVYHARLPIVGLGEGFDQPVRRITGDQGWLIAFVGEILDFREHHPRAECDLSVVTRGWLMNGSKALLKHDGFWSVVALSDDGALHLLTDYLGQKPLYYRQDVRACASEPDAVAALCPVTPDEVYLSACVKWGYCPEVERTPYNEVKRTRPGEHVVIDRNGQIRRRIVDQLEPLQASVEQFKAAFEAAVRRRVLSSDVPVACLVSGGVDSSIVYTLAKRYGEVKPYYVDDPGNPDEGEHMAVSAVLGEDCAKLQRTHFDRVEVRKALRIMQEPIDLGSLVPQVALSKIVSERVCLTGDGADEAFGGYGRSMRYDSQASDLFQELPAWHLPRLDRVMMRNRIEVRSPFLARDVVRMAMALPHALRQDKMFLRHTFAADLPKGLAYREKKPLRTSTIEADREKNSLDLVKMFRRENWPHEVEREEVVRVLSRSLRL